MSKFRGVKNRTNPAIFSFDLDQVFSYTLPVLKKIGIF
jgi:hypothetical protein